MKKKYLLFIIGCLLLIPTTLAQSPSCQNNNRAEGLISTPILSGKFGNQISTCVIDPKAVLDSKLTGKKYLFESIVSQDSCYIISYTFPSDAKFGNILSIPLEKLATLGEKVIQAGKKEVNMIIQIKSAPRDPEKGCSLTNKPPEFFEVE